MNKVLTKALFILMAILFIGCSNEGLIKSTEVEGEGRDINKDTITIPSNQAVIRDYTREHNGLDLLNRMNQKSRGDFNEQEEGEDLLTKKMDLAFEELYTSMPDDIKKSLYKLVRKEI